jgi:hypothetical protein
MKKLKHIDARTLVVLNNYWGKDKNVVFCF